jgi:LysR family glycine cleavage system transcriptional activator
MHRLRNHLPSANALFTFEAAARRRSFTAAAEELRVSQPAVSKMIRQFETNLGLRLFHRGHRQLDLTAEGKRLYHEIDKAFSALDATITAIRHTAHTDTVTASFSSAFLQFWLLPRLGDFYQSHPGITLSLQESGHDDFDIFADGIQVSSRLGHGDWPDLEAWKLVPEVIFPVCHPSYVAKNGGAIAPQDLPNARLLHFREKHRVRFGWRDWLAANAIPFTVTDETVIFSDALGSIGAASLGHGIALGWSHLVLDHILKGDLQQVGRARLGTGKSIYLVASRKAPLSPAATQFIAWILAQMAADRAAHPTPFQASL